MPDLVILTGPTGCGKSDLCNAAYKAGSSVAVINSDSKQIYREFPVLTAQPSSYDYKSFLYGHVSAFCSSGYSVVSWLKQFEFCVSKLGQSFDLLLVVGGTPLYLHCLINGIAQLPELPKCLVSKLQEKYDSDGREAILRLNSDIPSAWEDLDRYRLLRNVAYLVHTGKTIEQLYCQSPKIKPKYHLSKILALMPKRQLLYEKINQRFVQAINSGAIEEVESFIKMGGEKCARPEVMTIHGLREIISYLKGISSYEEMISKTQKNIRNYAKRQMTWLRNKFDGIKLFENQESLLDYLITKNNKKPSI